MYKVLVVDDDKDILDVVDFFLTASGFTVQQISPCEKILSGVRLFNPDLILLDINLSGCDGREICKQIKSTDSPFKNIPVVLFSADYNLKDNFGQSKADDFIPKPFDAVELISKIKKNILAA